MGVQKRDTRSAYGTFDRYHSQGENPCICSFTDVADVCDTHCGTRAAIRHGRTLIFTDCFRKSKEQFGTIQDPGKQGCKSVQRKALQLREGPATRKPSCEKFFFRGVHWPNSAQHKDTILYEAACLRPDSSSFVRFRRRMQLQCWRTRKKKACTSSDIIIHCKTPLNSALGRCNRPGMQSGSCTELNGTTNWRASSQFGCYWSCCRDLRPEPNQKDLNGEHYDPMNIVDSGQPTTRSGKPRAAMAKASSITDATLVHIKSRFSHISPRVLIPNENHM